MFIGIDGSLRSADLQRSKRLRGGVPQPAARTETSTLELFEWIVSEINRPDITVRAHPPYVALVSTEDWSVVLAVPLDRLCTDETLFVQLTHLKHVSGAQNVFVFNCHAPTSVVTEQRRRDVVTRLMEIGNEAQRSGGPHPAAAWIVGGDLNMSESALMQVSSKYAKANKPCFSSSGMRVTNDAQKSDVQNLTSRHV